MEWGPDEAAGLNTAEKREVQDRHAERELHTGLKESLRRNRNEMKISLFNNRGNTRGTKERNTARITDRDSERKDYIKPTVCEGGEE